MIAKKRLPWLIGVSAFLCASLLLGLFPAHFVQAQIVGTPVDVPMDDTLDNFEQGLFFRTALFREEDSETPRDGAVKLAPSGAMAPFREARITLPQLMIQMGAVAIGQRIYLIGGRAAAPGANAANNYLDTVWSGKIANDVNAETSVPTGLFLEEETAPGAVNNWRPEASLPPARGLWYSGATDGDLYTDPVTATYDMAVAVYDTPDPELEEGEEPSEPLPNDYIYVLGGRTTVGVNEYTLSSVRIGVVEPISGTITEWITSDDINTGTEEEPVYPMMLPEGDGFGLAGAMATTVTLTDTTYLYVIGGVVDVFGVDQRGAKSVMYARIGSDGRLYKPGTTGTEDSDIGWEVLEDTIPILDGQDGRPFENEEGLWDSALVTSQAYNGQQALYLIGGQTTREVPGVTSLQDTINVYGANFNEDGSIVWDEDKEANLPGSLSNHTAVEYDSNVYVVGGFKDATREDPTDEGLSTYVTDPETNMQFNQFSDNPPSYFNVPSESVLFRPRVLHASVAVSIKVDDYSNGFIYVLGGRGDSADSDESDDAASDSVYVYNVTNEPPPDSQVASQGWFVSRVKTIDLNSDEPKIEKISWETDFPVDTSGVDIQLEYRKANLSVGACSEASLNSSGAQWVPMDGDPDSDKFSKDGGNEFNPIDEEIATCFQYRGRFVAEGGVSVNNAPSLLNLNLRVFLPGSPDLWVERLEAATRNLDTIEAEEGALISDFDGLNLTIRNEYQQDRDMTLDAAPNVTDQGHSFYVDLFVFGPGFNESQVITPSLPLTTSAYIAQSTIVSSTLYTLVTKDDLPKLTSFSVPRNTWYESTCVNGCDPVNMADLFTNVLTETGTYNYTACVALDSYVSGDVLEDNPFGFVWEGMPGAEDNNFSCTSFPVTIERAGALPPPLATTQTMTPTFTVDGATRVDGIEVNLSRALTESLEIGFTLDEDSPLSRGSNYALYIENGGTAELMSANTVTIPAGQTSVILGVFMTDVNPNLDGKELTLTLNRPPLLNPEYQINEQDNATVIFEVERPEDNLLFLPLIAR